MPAKKATPKKAPAKTPAKATVKKPPVKADPLSGGEFIRITHWAPDGPNGRQIPTLTTDTVDAYQPFRFATTKARKLLRAIEEVGAEKFLLMLRHVAAYDGENGHPR